MFVRRLDTLSLGKHIGIGVQFFLYDTSCGDGDESDWQTYSRVANTLLTRPDFHASTSRTDYRIYACTAAIAQTQLFLYCCLISK